MGYWPTASLCLCKSSSTQQGDYSSCCVCVNLFQHETFQFDKVCSQTCVSRVGNPMDMLVQVLVDMGHLSGIHRTICAIVQSFRQLN